MNESAARSSGRDKLALALDVTALPQATEWIARMRGEVGVLKVGLELFTAAGPRAVEAVLDSGARCFLDLKLHDIPATVAHAVSSARALGVQYLTLHALAGREALEAAVEAAGPEMTLLAVTVLTSADAATLRAIGLEGPPEAAVLRLGRLAADAGVPGLVCSAHECAPLRAALGPAVQLVVPGIRPAGAALDDQRRAATPAAAIGDGADLLVVGRPIRGAADPVAA